MRTIFPIVCITVVNPAAGDLRKRGKIYSAPIKVFAKLFSKSEILFL